ncbi:RNA polymerase-ADP-ribosyltransferase Alt [Serratia phage 4S]|nr:RNA polymerase-ADP-ribosyltransferase Alt [Serratia phage 4S]
MSELNEVFDEDGKSYPVVNLKPKLKVPQLWSVSAPGNDELVVRMVSYMSEGDAIKQVKMGDKYAHVILMSLSKNGTPAELKGGLGSDPIGTMRTVFQTVYENVKKLHMDAIMFRFPAKKMKGQEKAIQRVIGRLCMSETGGRFVPLNALYQFTAKHAYVLVYRKSKPLDSISGIPDINTDLYTKVDSDVGDVYVVKKTGESVTKDVAIAGSIAAVEAPRSDKLVINRTKISRKQIASALYVSYDNAVYSKSKEFSDSSSLLSVPVNAPTFTDEQSKTMDTYTSGKAASERVAGNIAAVLVSRFLNEFEYGVMDEKFRKESLGKFEKIIASGKSMNSLEAAKALTEGVWKFIESRKNEYIAKVQKETKYDSEYVNNQAKWISDSEKQYKRRASSILSQSIREAVNLMTIPTIEAYRTLGNPKMTTKQRGIVREYTSSTYGDINNYLLGRSLEDGHSEKEIEELIKGLDDVFLSEGATKLPEGTTVYRGQKLRRPFFEKLVETRMYMFRNYVSTSMVPIMLGLWSANSTIAMAGAEDIKSVEDSNPEVPDFRDYTFSTNALGEPSSPKFIEELKYKEKVNLGWIISGADKINTIVPGMYGAHPNECEVILPRGTVLSIDKISSGTPAADPSNIQRLIEATVMTSEQLDEAVVYDGDHLLETGEHIVVSDSESPEVDPVSFASFTKTQRINIMELLAGMMDIEAMPDKFTM